MNNQGGLGGEACSTTSAYVVCVRLTNFAILDFVELLDRESVNYNVSREDDLFVVNYTPSDRANKY